MPNNLKANTPFSGTAKQTVLFSDIAAITAASVAIIFKVGNPLQSYIPGRSINPILAFEMGEGYYIMPKTDLDLNIYFLKSKPMQTLIEAPTIEWNLNNGDRAEVSLLADRNLTVLNHLNGDVGILHVYHNAAGTELVLPGTKKDGFAWKTGAGETTIIGFSYTAAKGFLWDAEGFTTTI